MEVTTRRHDVQQHITITIYKTNQNVKYNGLVIYMLWGEGFFLGFDCLDSLHGAIKVNTFEVCFGKLYQ